MALAAGAAVELALDSGAALSVDGPSRLALEGNARAVAIRLTAGKLNAVVAHRKPDETFAVITDDLRVRCAARSSPSPRATPRSRVDVTKGGSRFSARKGDAAGARAGGSFDSGALPAPPPELPDRRRGASAPRRRRAPPRALVPDDARAAVRASMRAGGSERALRQIADARRELRAADAICGAARPTAKTSSAT